MGKIEQSIDVNVPLSTAYNQWTQFEEFPRFMQGVKQVRQLDDKTLEWTAEIGGNEETWTAEISEQELQGVHRVARRRDGRLARRDQAGERRRLNVAAAEDREAGWFAARPLFMPRAGAERSKEEWLRR